MDPGGVPGWGLHGAVIAGLAAVLAAVAILERRSPSKGGWITLNGILAFLAGLCLACYAAASTITFALLRERIGVAVSYLVALPLAAVFGAVARALHRAWERGSMQARSERTRRDLTSCFELLKWSAVPETPGEVKVRASIRALRPLRAGFAALGLVEGNHVVAEALRTPEPRTLDAGTSGDLEVVLKHDPARAPTSFELMTTVWSGSEYLGVICHAADAVADAVEAESLLRRPLPPPTN